MQVGAMADKATPLSSLIPKLHLNVLVLGLGPRLTSLLLSHVPRPLPDFISQPWGKIGIKTTSQTGNGGLG